MKSNRSIQVRPAQVLPYVAWWATRIAAFLAVYVATSAGRHARATELDVAPRQALTRDFQQTRNPDGREDCNGPSLLDFVCCKDIREALVRPNKSTLETLRAGTVEDDDYAH